jgi:polyferredoxin
MLHPISGVPTFEIFSPLMAYSLCIYGVTTVIIYFIVGEQYALFSRENDFLHAVYYILGILIVVTSIYLPVLLWLDISNYIHYLRKWTEFQVGIVETRKQFY